MGNNMSGKINYISGVGFALSVSSFAYALIMDHAVESEVERKLKTLQKNQHEILGYLKLILAEIQWTQIISEADGAFTNINYQFEQMLKLQEGDTKEASKWAKSILDQSEGIKKDLYIINQLMMGNSPLTAPLMSIFADKIKKYPTNQSKYMEAKWYFRTINEIQTKGFCLLSNAFNLENDISSNADPRTKKFLSEYDNTLYEQQGFNKEYINALDHWYHDPTFNGDYFDINDGYNYVDTSEVMAPTGRVIVGMQLYRKGNRIALKIATAIPVEDSNIDQNSIQWVENPEFNNSNYFTLDDTNNYVDERKVKFGHGNNVMIGARLFKLGNRIAISIKGQGLNGKTGELTGPQTPWIQMNDLNPPYFDIEDNNHYVNTHTVLPDPNYYTSGAQLFLFGNRIAVKVETGV
jgi:hypothetical protein